MGGALTDGGVDEEGCGRQLSLVKGGRDGSGDLVDWHFNG